MRGLEQAGEKEECDNMKNLFHFIDAGTSPYHVVKCAADCLDKNGFCRLEESGEWTLRPRGKYYVTRNQSSLIAFTIPEKKIQVYHMTASHSDSPAFRIKKTKTGHTMYAMAEVEGYGGMIMSSWFDRPLTFAGRVIVRTNHGVESKLVRADRDVFVIPNLAIHFNREINKGYKYNPQIDLQPLYGGRECGLQTLIAKEAGVKEEEILDMDLVLSVRQKAGYLGAEKEFFMAPRIDDLSCAFAALRGFVSASPKKDTANVYSLFDNEEVGSGSRQGALGNFLPQVTARAAEKCGLTWEENVRALSRSLLISADNAHATHPNLPAKSDSEFPVELNKGIVIKYNASQKYTTTGMTAAVFSQFCKENGRMVQRFANRADAPGGSTLGNLLSQQLSIPMLDIGIPQLAMHSAVETAGCRDIKDMKKILQAFYESSLRQNTDGRWEM